MPNKILFLDDRWPEAKGCLAALPANLEVICEENGGQALHHLEADRDIRAVLLDLKFEGQPKQGEQILNEIKERYPDLPVVILTSVADVELGLRLVHKEKKAHYYFFKDRIDPDQLSKELENAIGYYTLRGEAIRKTDRGLIVGDSAVLREVLRLVGLASQSDGTVLITGESGTGKELVARAIHLNSQRKDRPFIAVNCGAIPETLIESELFGHTKGAFSGAIRDRRGLFEAADTGTLFLDEIGELPLEQQVRLLRVLDSGEVQKLGGSRPTTVDARVIAATNRDLVSAVQGKQFREDLYYRLNVFPIHAPALRERREDIAAIARYVLMSRLNSRKELSPEALILLREYGWPGNVRELSNVLERLNATIPSDLISREDIAPLLGDGVHTDESVPQAWVAKVFTGQATWADLRKEFKGSGETLRQIFDGVVRRWIEQEGERPSGNELASLLKTNRNHIMQVLNTLRLKLKDYDA